MATIDGVDLSRLSDRELLELDFLLRQRDRFDQMSEEEERRLMYRARLEASSAEFFRTAWSVLEPGSNLEWSWHYEYIGEHLDAVFASQIKRLIINVPPRTGKSLFATVCFPAWAWAKRPELRFLTASYSSDLSSDHSANRRRLMESQWFRHYWNIELSKDTNRRDQYRNLREGEMIATSVGATAMGQGGHILILDDGMSADEAKSKTKRENAHDWYKGTFYRRLDDPANGAIVVIEQRTHADDMTGWLLTNEPDQWTHIKVPLVQEKPQQYSFPSGRAVTRESGDTIQPRRFTPEVIAGRRVHARTFATQDQQEPAPDSGIVFMREWWRFIGNPLSKYDWTGTSWDFAVEGNADSDYNCGIYFGKIGADIHILDLFKERLAFPMQLRAFVEFYAKHPDASKHLVEKKANGPAIIATIQSKISGVIAIEPQGSKFQRADAASADCESGNVYLLEGQTWTLNFIENQARFPNGANDDDTDAFSQLVNYCRGKNYAYGLLGLQERQDAETATAREEYMKQANQMVKPDTPAQAVRCPKCNATTTRRMGNVFHCNNCRHQWPAVQGAPVDTTPYMRK